MQYKVVLSLPSRRPACMPGHGETVHQGIAVNNETFCARRHCPARRSHVRPWLVRWLAFQQGSHNLASCGLCHTAHWVPCRRPTGCTGDVGKGPKPGSGLCTRVFHSSIREEDGLCHLQSGTTFEPSIRSHAFGGTVSPQINSVTARALREVPFRDVGPSRSVTTLQTCYQALRRVSPLQTILPNMLYTS